jgi:hypothetical protein
LEVSKKVGTTFTLNFLCGLSMTKEEEFATGCRSAIRSSAREILECTEG